MATLHSGETEIAQDEAATSHTGRARQSVPVLAAGCRGERANRCISVRCSLWSMDDLDGCLEHRTDP
eukprot:COSAG01_NODE_6410_length_3681_cov_11.529592_3_plen_67_part_00